MNLDRDPRWGRTDEAPGEDPYPASQKAGAFLDGYQGETIGGTTTATYLNGGTTAEQPRPLAHRAERLERDGHHAVLVRERRRRADGANDLAGDGHVGHESERLHPLRAGTRLRGPHAGERLPHRPPLLHRRTDHREQNRAGGRPAHANGDYVTADDAGANPLIANRTSIGQAQEFDLTTNADGSASPRAHANNDIVTAS